MRVLTKNRTNIQLSWFYFTWMVYCSLTWLGYLSNVYIAHCKAWQRDRPYNSLPTKFIVSTILSVQLDDVQFCFQLVAHCCVEHPNMSLSVGTGNWSLLFISKHNCLFRCVKRVFYSTSVLCIVLRSWDNNDLFASVIFLVWSRWIERACIYIQNCILQLTFETWPNALSAS